MKTWKQRIDSATRRGHFTDEDKVAAGNWPTCQLSERIFLGDAASAPEDTELYMLGVDFADAVAEGWDIQEAKRIRSAILKLTKPKREATK